MKIDQDSRRTTAQFLNGLAVSVLTALVIGPLAAGTTKVAPAAVGIIGAALLHLAALHIGRRSRRR
jgi:hypothetical protein